MLPRGAVWQRCAVSESPDVGCVREAETRKTPVFVDGKLAKLLRTHASLDLALITWEGGVSHPRYGSALGPSSVAATQLVFWACWKLCCLTFGSQC